MGKKRVYRFVLDGHLLSCLYYIKGVSEDTSDTSANRSTDKVDEHVGRIGGELVQKVGPAGFQHSPVKCGEGDVPVESGNITGPKFENASIPHHHLS